MAMLENTTRSNSGTMSPGVEHAARRHRGRKGQELCFLASVGELGAGSDFGLEGFGLGFGLDEDMAGGGGVARRGSLEEEKKAEV